MVWVRTGRIAPWHCVSRGHWALCGRAWSASRHVRVGVHGAHRAMCVWACWGALRHVRVGVHVRVRTYVSGGGDGGGEGVGGLGGERLGGGGDGLGGGRLDGGGDLKMDLSSHETESTRRARQPPLCRCLNAFTQRTFTSPGPWPLNYS